MSDIEKLDDALEWVRTLAAKHSDRVSRIEISVRGDGRVTISVEDGPYTRARIEADLCEGAANQWRSGRPAAPWPSAAICDLRDELEAASRSPEGSGK